MIRINLPIPLTMRILPPLPTGLFLLATVIVVTSIPFSIYLRAHKRETANNGFVSDRCNPGMHKQSDPWKVFWCKRHGCGVPDCKCSGSTVCSSCLVSMQGKVAWIII